MRGDLKDALNLVRIASIIGAPILEELGRRVLAGRSGRDLTRLDLHDLIGGESLSEVIELIVREQARKALAKPTATEDPK